MSALPEAVEPAEHPAKFSPEILDAIADLTEVEIPRGALVLDPLAGTGRIHWLGGRMGWHTVGVEIEPEWAAHHSATILGDSTDLPEHWTGTFDAAIWSPVYGNRMSDHHNAQERCKPCGASGQVEGETCEKCGGSGRRTYKRNTYKHTLDRRRPDGTVDDLHPNNAGQMQFRQQAYKDLHRKIYAEVARVTTSRAMAVINVSNFLRAKGTEEVDVTGWHVEALGRVGFREVRRVEVETRRNGHGANRDIRCPFESVILLEKRRYPCP